MGRMESKNHPRPFPRRSGPVPCSVVRIRVSLHPRDHRVNECLFQSCVILQPYSFTPQPNRFSIRLNSTHSRMELQKRQHPTRKVRNFHMRRGMPYPGVNKFTCDFSETCSVSCSVTCLVTSSEPRKSQPSSRKRPYVRDRAWPVIPRCLRFALISRTCFTRGFGSACLRRFRQPQDLDSPSSRCWPRTDCSVPQSQRTSHLEEPFLPGTRGSLDSTVHNPNFLPVRSMNDVSCRLQTSHAFTVPFRRLLTETATSSFPQSQRHLQST